MRFRLHTLLKFNLPPPHSPFNTHTHCLMFFFFLDGGGLAVRTHLVLYVCALCGCHPKCQGAFGGICIIVVR